MPQSGEKAVPTTRSAKATYSRIRSLLEHKRVSQRPSWLTKVNLKALTKRIK